MKGYKRRQSHNGGRAQQIAANRERKRQEREAQHQKNIEEAKEILRILNANPNAKIEMGHCVVPNSIGKMVCEKYLKDNGEEI